MQCENKDRCLGCVLEVNGWLFQKGEKGSEKRWRSASVVEEEEEEEEKGQRKCVVVLTAWSFCLLVALSVPGAGPGWCFVAGRGKEPARV